ncbi:MAG: bifunctional folylpolyglutamate synthase/dihydrofolate synthase [Terriglobales bacterium]
MSYDSAVAQLYELGHELARTPSHKFDLAHMRLLLEGLGSPERQFRSVLIAGTNGKGSTAATLASILRAAGHRTGMYTSPHLARINERIRINGQPISDADFTLAHDDVESTALRLVEQGKLPWHPSFFEVLTAMAFLHFARKNIEIAVLEVGMGGRLDATNVVEPLVSVITDISLDHQKFLGNTIREIAGEKAGIIRAGGTIVTLPQHPEANDVIGNTILEREARAVSAVPYVPPVSPGAEPGDTYAVTVLGEEIKVASPLLGRHQLRNVALAIATAVELDDAGLRLVASDIERGIRDTAWPGRFQIAHAGGFDVVLDVAHNPAGAWALRSALSQRFEGRPLVFVFGAMRDKAIAEMAEILFPLAERVIAARAENPRSASPEEIREAGVRTGAVIELAPSVRDAIVLARREIPPNGVVVITGSIYVVGEAMQALAIRGA